MCHYVLGLNNAVWVLCYLIELTKGSSEECSLHNGNFQLSTFLTWELHVEHIDSLGEKQAFWVIKRRVLDIEQQTLRSLAHSVCSPLHWHITVTPSQQAPYLVLLKSPRIRRAFTLARCNVMPSAVLYGRFQGLPLDKRCCSCGMGSVETLDHIFFYCPLHKEP
ncbi:hypothetical protein JRQ81_004695, partial [Phrynocephalus forsythii]